LLIGYLPPTKSLQGETLKRKRAEYKELCDMHFKTEKITELSDYNQTNYKQILADVPRTMPEFPIFQTSTMQNMLTRILYIWNIRHPASGYVQGINDLCTPFIITYLGEHFKVNLEDVISFNNGITEIGIEKLEKIEADVYWSLCKIIDKTQDVYTPSQPGAHKMLARVKEMVKRVNEKLFKHIENQGIDFIQFAFRWVPKI